MWARLVGPFLLCCQRPIPSSWAVPCRLAWACLQRGLDLRGAILPAFLEALATGGEGLGPAAAPAARARWAEWRALCRM